MKNDVRIKVLYIIDESGETLDFEFNNNEKKFLGSVIITSKGKVSWEIADLNYLNNIMELICYVMNDYNIRRVHYETKDEKIGRWNNACTYIYIRNLVVNRRFNYASNLKNQSRHTR